MEVRTSKIVLVTAGSSDWQAIYVDGKLVHSDNSIDAYEAITALGGETITLSDEAAEIVLDSYYPIKLKDLKR